MFDEEPDETEYKTHIIVKIYPEKDSESGFMIDNDPDLFFPEMHYAKNWIDKFM